MTSLKLFPKEFKQDGVTLGIDALLLAAFVLQSKIPIKNFVELGVGNGMASCALGLNLESACGLGFDIVPSTLMAAKYNAQTLNLNSRLYFEQVNVEDKKNLIATYTKCLGKVFAQLVISNPPYCHAKNERQTTNTELNLALQGGHDTLNAFCKAAYILLKHHGHFFCIYMPKHLTSLLQALEDNKFGVRRILNIHSRKNHNAQWVLVHARKDAMSDVEILPSLYLYTGKQGLELTEEIIEFCPWIS